MFLNKKGQADVIGNFISTIPKPVLFLLFMVLLIFVGSLLSSLFQGFGVYCNSVGLPVKLENSNLFSNFGLMSSLPDADEIGGDSLSVPDSFFDSCLKFINGSDRYMGGRFVSCDYMSGEFRNYCVGDAFSIAKEDLSWFKRASFGLYQCKIPEGYYFEFDSGRYVCLTADCGSKTLARERDVRLNNLGAVPLYSDVVSDDSAKGFFRVGCSSNLKPELTLKGIPLFRLEYWAILMLVTILLWGVMRFGKR